MTTNNPEIEIPDTAQPDSQTSEEKEERKRRWLLLLLLLLLLICCCLGYFILRYLMNPQPLPEMVPIVNQVNYPPTYRSMITGVDKPVGVAMSPDGQRLYVVESGGERLVKIFNREGAFLNSFAIPGTDWPNREPRYIAVAPDGRVFVVDRIANAIYVFDEEGNHLDVILALDMTATKLLTQELGSIPEGLTYRYEGINRILYYTLPGQVEEKSINMPMPKAEDAWAPLGIRFDAQGNLLYTDIAAGLHSVHIIPAADINNIGPAYTPFISKFGAQGQGAGQFDFPQVTVTDSLGNYYVIDGNNARISSWNKDLQYQEFFAFGSTEGGMNLPRGAWIDQKDRLHVVDAVASIVRVYDVSGEEPAFLYNFGAFGIAEGEFNYPIDIYMDGTGRLYIADRDNNRIQVWSY